MNSTDTPDITVDLDDNEAEAIYQAFQQGQLDSVDLKGIFARPAEWLAESDTDVAYDIRQARAAAGPEGACYVNVYSIDRAYGGPEEGGWWYDTGQVIISALCPDPDQAKLVADALRETFPRTGKSSSVNGGEDYAVEISDKPGTDFPTERPHFE